MARERTLDVEKGEKLTNGRAAKLSQGDEPIGRLYMTPGAQMHSYQVEPGVAWPRRGIASELAQRVQVDGKYEGGSH